jgi:hypothetical protein
MAVRKAECDMGLGGNCISGIFVIVSRKRIEVNPFVEGRIPLVYGRYARIEQIRHGLKKNGRYAAGADLPTRNSPCADSI